MLPLALSSRTRSDAVALLSGDGRQISYRDLPRMLSQPQRLLDFPEKALVAIFADRDLDSAMSYLASLSIGHACGFFGTLPAAVQDVLIEKYQPEFVVCARGSQLASPGPLGGYEPSGTLSGGAVVLRRARPGAGEIGADLSLLLATSGSTGSPTVVRLSTANIEANASAIVQALGIRAAGRAATSLPLSHCYGLSVLNSHLVAGASVVICAERVLSAGFWKVVSRNDVTSVAGVPVIYETLHSRRFDLTRFPSLTTLTHSGGPLAHDVVSYFAELMERNGGQFWLMYGQTEATGRITCLPPGELSQRPGSVGRVVPGGQLRIEDSSGAVVPDGERGAVVYSGPAVMLGYAQSRADLGQGDVMHGHLATGDVGYLQHGCLYLTGRAKRIVKVLGFRVELDQIQAAFGAAGPAAAVRGAGETIVVFTQCHQGGHQQIRASLLRQLGIPPSALVLRQITQIPVTRSGKPDYPALTALALGGGPADAETSPAGDRR
jgi:acyl-CoA synthetase (AMP-forming)/AMP-acid ligase II